MKKVLSIFLCCLLLTGCGGNAVAEATYAAEEPTRAAAETVVPSPQLTAAQSEGAQLVSRFDSETVILLSDEGITVDGGEETEAVYTSRDIIYYEDKDAYESGNPYGEGKAADKHTAQEADAHLVVNITAPGAYRVSGKLAAGQIRVDLGEDAYYEPDAVVELILDGADITCTVAPAILFLNTYECDGSWSEEDAKPQVDTSAAGANLILEKHNTVNGSYVAKIYKDKEGEKKLWKQDGAIYSYMSMNVWGSGSLELTAQNEGMDTELHLTVNGGDIVIRSDNDGINTNEDGVSVTTINGGCVQIYAGLGAEGDGIDSNGYLVINGGVVFAAAHPAADSGMDSDLGTYINGGTVLALGSSMNQANSDSAQTSMNLQFSASQQPGSSLVVTDGNGTVVFAYAPDASAVNRSYTGAILSCPNLKLGSTYQVCTGGSLKGGEAVGCLVDVTTVTGYEGGTQLQHAGASQAGGFGGFGGGRPDMGNFQPGERPEGEFERPEGFDGRMPGGFEGDMPEGFDPSRFERPEGDFGGRGQGGERPEGFDPSAFEGGKMPEGMPQGGFGNRGEGSQERSPEFVMSEKVLTFRGVTTV